jgi:hypothetical protein
MTEFRPIHATDTAGDTDGLAEFSNTDGLLLPNYNEKTQSLTSSYYVLSIDAMNGNAGTITLSENISTIAFTNIPTTGTYAFTLFVTQDSTDRTVAINDITINGATGVTGLTPAGAGYTVSTGSAAKDIVSFVFVNGGTPFITVQQAYA